VPYAALADAVVLLHVAFVAFVALGGLLVARWPRLAFVHVPAAVWGALVELCGWLCPLTPLENRLREASGGAGFEEGFVEHHLVPLLYPGTLTRELQALLGALVVFVNLLVYGWIWRRARRRGHGI
jgi:hypothetical protein